mgnify:CR=1 FL=1
MTKFIETVLIEDGTVCHLDYHSRRYARTLQHHFLHGKAEEFNRYVKNVLAGEPMSISKGIFKLRVIYSDKPLSYTLEPYQSKEIKTLKLVEDDSIDYNFKYENRCSIERLLSLRGECDDILIVKNGYITDTSYCNIIFEKDGQLFTPSTPLLAGTKRERLINTGTIKEEKIRPCDIRRYDKVYLINSMLDFVQVEKITL